MAFYPRISILFSLAAALFLSGCNSVKHLAEDEVLYTGAEIKLQSSHPVPQKARLMGELENLLRPEPNLSIFGLRPSLWFYNLAGETEKEKGIRHFVKTKLGNPPVLLSDVRPDYVSNLIKNRLYNYGYFDAEVDHQLDREKKKKAGLTYLAGIDRPYRLRNIEFETDSTQLGQDLRELSAETLLEEGRPYRLGDVRAERDRIDRALKNRGYFFFSSDHLHLTADTTVGNRQMDLFIGLDQQMPRDAGRVYTMNQIILFPNYQLGEETSITGRDTIDLGGYVYVDRDDANEFRPRALTETIFFEQGKPYTRRAHELTLNRLMGLGTFKFVDVRFEHVDSIGQGKLDAYIFMTPQKKKSVRAELAVVSKSNSFIGPGIKGNWRNRNIFGGAELLSIDVTAGFETLVGGDPENTTSATFSSYQLGLRGELFFPKLITPFDIGSSSDFVPKTRFSVEYELVNRLKFFLLNSASFRASYLWNQSRLVEHELTPLNFTFIQLSRSSEAFRELLDSNPFLRMSFAEQFIIGPEYSFTYSDQILEEVRNPIYFNGKIGASNPGSFLGETFSTYGRFSFDFRYYFQLSNNSKLVSRLSAGLAVPYGKSETVPYVKQFFSGGPNSIRAFRARTIGPGTYTPSAERVATSFQDQNGNVKIEGNLEYRFNIYGIFDGALFIDAGNVWLLEEDPSFPGGKLEFGELLGDLAVGVGPGLRIDASFFVLRVDLGWPLRNPSLPRGERWEIPFRDSSPTLNIAIDYPF